MMVCKDIKQEYFKLTNMSYSELKTWSKTNLSKKASLSREPIKRNLRLLFRKNKKWSNYDCVDALKTINYIKRASKIRRSKKILGDDYTKNEIALKNWGYDVKKNK